MAQQKQPESKFTPAGRVQTGDSTGAAKPTGPPKIPPGKTWLWLLGVLLANYLLVRLLLPGPEAPITVPYTLFKEQVGKGNVEAIYSQGESITGRFKTAVTYPPADEKNAASDKEQQTANERPATPR